MFRWIRGKTNWSLRRQLVFSLGLVGLVPLLILLCLSVPFLRQQVENTTAEDYRERARVLGIGVGLMLEEALSELEQVCNVPDVRESFETTADLNESINQLAGVLSRSHGRFVTFRLVDLRGQVYAEIGEGGYEGQPSAVTPPWQRRSIDPWVDEVLPGPNRGSYLVALSCPILGHDDAPVGHLVACYDAYRLLAQATHTSLGTDGIAGIVNRTGRVVYRDGTLRDGFVVSPLAGAHPQSANRSQIGPLFRDDATEYLIALSPISDRGNLPGSLAHTAPFSVLVAEPHRSVMARADESVRWVLGSGFVVMSFLCVAAAFLARRISRPLLDLTERVREMGGTEDTTHTPEGGVTNEVIVLHDAFHSMRQRVVQHQEVLQERHVELQDVVRRLQAADRLKDEFLSFLSHEVKTPLSAIRSFAELLRSTPEIDADDRSEFLSIIEQECNRLTRLSSDLLDFAMIDSGDMPWRDALLDPCEVVESVLRTMNVLAAKNTVHLHLQREPDLPVINADRDRIVQLLTNLVSNALKYTPRKGQVTIRLFRTGDDHESLGITVQDTGPGIPDGYHEKIFDRFVRVQDRERRLGPLGTGLGLTICRRIVDHYGGSITAAKHEGRGALLHVMLPPAATRREGVVEPSTQDIGSPA